MKKKLLSILALLCMTVSGAWAQVGRVLATDGKYYKTVTAATNAGTKASGMIVYWGDGDASDNTYNQGLVIELSDVVKNVKWGEQQDVTGITNTGQNAASSMVDLRGIANTDAIVSKWPVGIYPYAACYCRNISTARPSSSSNWFLPSQGQFVLMMNSYGAGYGTSTAYAYDNTTKGEVVTSINNALTNAGGTALSNGRYWTSTEINTDLAGDWSASNSSFGFNGKTQEHYVRAMFAFSGATAAEYTVSYNANGGSGAPSAQTKDGGIDLTLSSTVPTRDGYTFTGWNTKADGSGTSYAAGASYTANADVTLYAQWTQNTASLTDGEGITALLKWTGETCTVTYTRAFTADKPSTVCLPFAYAPKTGETFYTFSGITKDGDNYVATMTEAATSPLTANTPYLFMPTGDADFSGTYEIPASLTAGTTTNGDWTFKGTYSTIEWTTAPTTPTYGFSAQNVGEDITKGQFVKVGTYVRIKPMRAYLEYTGSDSQFKARALTRAAATDEDETLPETIKVRLIGADGTVTAIGTLHTRTGEVSFDPEAWYTLDGKRLAGQPTQKGIYVNNGKKVVIK